MDFIHFTHHQFAVRTIGNYEQHFLGVENIVVVQQRGMKGIGNSLCDSSFAFSVSCTHDCYTTVLQHGFHIVEVQVDDTSQGNDFCNTLCGDRQRVVCLSKGIHYTDVGIYIAQAFVVDNQQGIYMLAHFFHSVKSLVDFLVSFEQERNGHDTYGQDFHVLSRFGNDRSCTGSGSTTHTSRDECHAASVVQHILDVFNTFFSSSTCLGRTVSGSQSFATQL